MINIKIYPRNFLTLINSKVKEFTDIFQYDKFSKNNIKY